MKTNIAFAGILICILLGCSAEKTQTVFSGDFLEIGRRYSGEVKQGGDMTIAEMTPDDVIVMVNGYPLTKRVFDELMVIKATRLSRRKGGNPALLESLLNQFKQKYIPLFVSQRLLLDKARELNVLTVEEVERAVNEDLAQAAKGRRTTIEGIVKAFPGDFKYYLYDAAAQKWMDALIENHIPPKCVVDDAFVSNCQVQVTLENAATSKSNETIRATMAGWKRDVLTGKLSFDELARKYSQDESSDTNNPSFWGEFERGCIEDKALQAKVFALKVGEISDPIEDDEGYHLVKVLKSTPPVKNEKGRMVQDEIRKLAHVFCEKIPLLIVEDDEAVREDLKQQMKMQAIDDYVENLKTNGAYKVVYPHGQKLF